MIRRTLTRFVFAAAAIATLAITATFASPQAGTSMQLATFKIDAVHSSVIFRIRHNGVGNFWGRFNDVKGEFRLDPEALDSSSVTVEIPLTSIDTGNKGRDEHVTSPQILNAAEFLTATFKSTSFEKGDSKHFTVKGDLTMHGKTNPVTAKVEWIGMRDTGRQGFRCGVEAQFTFERSKWGIDYGIEGGALGDDVMMIIAVEGVRQ